MRWLVVALLTTACADKLDLAGSACPCVNGFQCCANACVAAGELCPSQCTDPQEQTTGGLSAIAHRASARFIVDGDPSEWADVQTHALLRSPLGRETQQDFSGTYAVAWDTARLYVFIQVRDDVLVPPDSGTNYFSDDSAELYLDVSPTGATHYDGDSEDQFFVAQPGRLIKTPAYPTSKWTGTAVFNHDDANLQWWFEVGIDWPPRFAQIPQPGAVLGFDVAINDDDTVGVPTGDDREGQLFWNDASGLAAQNPSLFGTVTLDDCTLP